MTYPRWNWRVFLLLALLPLALTVFAGECTWEGVERIVAVGDVHGDYDQFFKVLRVAKLVDEQGHWTGGKTHLVQLGDVPDRGAHTRRVMDLLMRLEKEAPKAGGYVHCLIGNHEAMNVYGDYRFVTPGEIEAFGGIETFRREMGKDGTYGKWILSHNTVIKINDALFLHGGLCGREVALSLGEINEQVREGLAAGGGGLARDKAGPLWFRGLSLGSEEAVEDLTTQILQAYGVNRIVVGHTVSQHGVQPRLGGHVIMADVGMSAAYGGPVQCVLMEEGKWFALGQDGRRPLPALLSPGSAAEMPLAR